jgi:orotidine-5'-phosphate decarboxylase
MPNFTERLRAASEAANSLLCVGLDPDPARIPLPGVTEFNRAIVSATADLVCAFKPNLAFYEALGLPGWNALEKTVRHIRDVAPHSIIIGDGKRGDIDSSAAAYATAMFDVWGFDCVTVNPWGGMDTVEPWLTNPEKGAFIWCRGSNRGAADLQDLAVSGVGNLTQPVYLRLARRSQQRASQGNLGLVVGATAPQQLAEVRRICPDLPLLIPGIGAQGGDLADSVRCGVDSHGRLAVINASRSIIYASSGADYASAARHAASRLRDEINATLDSMGLGWQ